MNVERIKKLIAHLETVPRRGFDMNTWSEIVANETLSRKHHEAGYACGMAACLGGHAALVFPRLLRVDLDGLYTYDREYGYSMALGRVLDLCDRCALLLTIASAPHTTPKKAVRTLRRLLAGRPWPARLAGIPVLRRTSPSCSFGDSNCSLEEVEL